jgi:RES domain-containing protein
LRAWRICKRRYLETAFSGEGAYRYGGRWNSKGRRVLYLGGSAALAALEVIVHLKDASDLDQLDYVYVPVDFDSELVSYPTELPDDWNHYPAPLSAAKLGDDWVSDGHHAILEVPSAVISVEKNYLLNPLHSDFRKIAIGEPVAFEFDSRLKKLWSHAHKD